MLFGKLFLADFKQQIDKALSEAKDVTNGKTSLLNISLFNKLISFIRKGKNAEDGDEVQQYIVNNYYRIDVKNLLTNKDKWIMKQNYRDFLIQILYNNTSISDKDKEDFEKLMIEMFRTSVSDVEKSQIVDITTRRINIRDQEFAKKFYRFYNNLDDTKDGLILIKTNGFFSDDTSNVYYKSKIQERKEILDSILENVDSSLKNEIKAIFNEFNKKQDNFREMQLRKVKIYLLLKTIKSNIYEKSDKSKKKQLIQRVLRKEHHDFKESILDTFCEKCDFGIMASIPNYSNDEELLSTINGLDIVSNLSDNYYGLVQKQKINDVFERINLFNNISFFEIKDSNCFDDDFIYTNNFISKNGESNLLLCFSSSQKEQILSAIYANKYCCEKIANKKYDINSAPDIYSFAKICKDVENDPMPSDNCKEVYNKYYLHESYKGIGGLSEDKNFSIKSDSNENFIRNDLSCNVISTKELLEILQIQAKSARPLHELKLTISDIKNLPAMIKKYNDFISSQRDVFNNRGLTPIDNLVIKNIDILSTNEIKQLVNALDNSPVCFKTLKIDDPNVFNYVVSNIVVESVKNNHIMYGKNDNFSHEINKERLKRKIDKHVFSSGGAKAAYTKYSKVTEDEFKISDLDTLKVKCDAEQEFKSLQKDLNSRLAKSSGPDNDIELNVSVSTNVDKNIEFVMNMDKEPPSLDDLKENELISYENVDEKMKDLLSKKSKRFSEETKSFLLHVKEKLQGSFKELFNEVTNRKYLSNVFKKIQFRDSSFYLTPEAFVSLMENFLYGGMTKFNGRIGDQKLSVFKVCNGKKYVVGMTAKNINYGHINPIEEMFTFIPTNTVGLSKKQLETKYEKEMATIIRNQRNIENEIDLLGENYGYLKKVLLNNASNSGIEYLKYVSDNADEILGFVEYLKGRKDFADICDSVCGNFCNTTQIGDIKLLFSLINPVNFIRGMQKVFDLIDSLKSKGFIDDNFIKQLPYILDKNKYAIQVLYERLLKRKIDVEKIIISDRNYKSSGEKISVDVNDVKDVETYFSREENVLTDDEKRFSQYSFSGILEYTNINIGRKKFSFWNDVSYVDDCLESGGFVHNNIPQDIIVHLGINVSKPNTVSYTTTKQEHAIYTDYLNLCYFLNKRHNRLSDGSIDEPNLSKEEEKLISNKVEILSLMNDLINASINGETDRKRLFVVVKLYKDIIDKKNYGIFPEVEEIKELTDDDIVELYENIKANEDNAFLEYILMTGGNDGGIKQVKKVLKQKLEEIKKDEVANVVEGDNGRQYESKFAITMFILFNEINTKTNKNDIFGFEHEQIEQIIALYQTKYPYNLISCIKDIHDNFYTKEELKDLKLYIALPDEMFCMCFDKYYTNQLKTINEKDIKLFVKYCCAIDNDGKYSVLCNTKKKHYKSIHDNKEAVDIFYDYLNKFSKQDALSVIEMANQCSTKGLDLIELIRIIKQKKGVEEKNMFRYIYFLQQIYLSSVQKFKSISLHDLSHIFDVLQKVYFKNCDIEKDNNNTLTYIESQTKQDIDNIVNIFSSNVQKLYQKICILSDNCQSKDRFSVFLQNFSSLIDSCNKILKEEDEKQQIRFDKASVESIIAKASSEYDKIIKIYKEQEDALNFEIIGKIFDKVNENVNFFFSKINTMKMCFIDAIEKNDKTKQSTMINLFGKTLLLIKNHSLEDICLVFRIIGDNNLVTDSDILNKFSFIVEHINDYKDKDNNYINNIYKQISDLYNLSKGEKYLSTGLSHDELMKILSRIKTQNNNTKSAIDYLKIAKDQIMKDFKNNVSNNGGFLKNNIIDKVDNALFKVVNGCSDLIDKLYNKDDGRATLEKINKMLSGKDVPIEVLFQDESISLLGDENSPEMQNIMSIISDVFSKLIKDQRSVEMILTDYENKMKNKQQISNQDRLKFIAAFLVNHTKEQNKTLRCHQLAAIMLENFRALNNALVLNDNSNLRNINLIQTGGGKTLTMLFGLFAATMEDLSAFAVTTNMLLVNEMMNDAEKNSLYKNHIFYLDDNQNLIEKSTNRKVPITEILEILKDKRNKFFTTYKDLSFWIQKLLRERSGLDIVRYLKSNGSLFLDEVDSVINAKTSNKISVSCNADMRKYNIALNMQKLYDYLKENDNIEDFQDKIENFDLNINNSMINDTQKTANELMTEIIKNIEPLKGQVPAFNELDNESKAYILKMAIACVDANKMKDGVEYTITTNTETGSTTILPITGGEPDDSGSRFDPYTNMALKVKLKIQNGCYFDDMLSNTMIISEGNNASVINYFKKSSGFSGTIYGAREIWGQKKGFKVRNIQTMSVPNVKRLILPCSITTKDGNNPLLDFILLCSAVSNRNNLRQYENFLQQKFEIICENNQTGCCKNEDFNEIFKSLAEAGNKDYFITFMRDSNELEAFQKRLETNLNELKEHAKSENIDFKCPEIMVLDKKQYLQDDNETMSKLEDKKNNNFFVFALPDKSRGVDFPGSPKVLLSSIFNNAVDRQTRGRTGRNGKPGTIIEAYSIKEEDYDNFKEKSTSLRECATLLKNELSKKDIDDFLNKDFYYRAIEFISTSTSIFLNVATEGLDNDTREKVLNDSNQILGHFIEMTNKNYKNIERNEHELQQFYEKVSNDVIEILQMLYNKCCIFPDDNKPSLYYLIRKTLKICGELGLRDIVPAIDDNLADEDYRDVFPEEAYNNRVEYINKSIKKKMDKDWFQEISNNGQQFLYTALGCANACGYSLNLNCDMKNVIGEGRSIRILKKKILDGNSEPFSYAERYIVLFDLKLGDNIENILQEEKVKEILSTLPKDALSIFSFSDNNNSDFFVAQGLSIENFSFVFNKNSVEQNNIDYVFGIAEIIKKYTQENFVNQKHVIDFIQKKKEEFRSKVSNIQVSDDNKQQLLENDACNRLIGYVEKGYKQYDMKPTEFTADMKAKYSGFQKEIKKLAKFSLEPAETDLTNIDKGEKSLLFVLNKKIVSFVEKIRKLKDEIEDCNEIEYEKKKALMREINELDSKNNLVECLKRAMKNIAFSSHIQETLNEFDVLKHEINIDNIDASEIELQKLMDSIRNSEDFADSVKNSNINEDTKLKKTLYSGYNDIVSNISYARNKLDKIKSYKNELDIIKDNKSFFNGFSEEEMVITSDEISNCLDKYQRFINNIEKEDKNVFSERQKEQLRDRAIDEHIDNAIKVFNEINKVFNEFTLTYENGTDFSDIGINEHDIKLINNIKERYIKKFKKISKNGGVNWPEIIKEIYDKNDDVEYNDDEDVKNIKDKYNADLASFKGEVKKLLLGYQNDITQKDISDVERKKQLPVVAYTFLEKMLKFLQRNYKKNLEAHNNVKKDIIKTIQAVFNLNKTNIYNVHDQFKNDLSDLFQNIPEFDINSNSTEIIDVLDKAFDKFDIATLKGIQKNVSRIVSDDVSRMKEVVKKMEAKNNEPNDVMKIVYVICTLGLILLTEEGRNMFRKKKIIQENIQFEEDIKPKPYLAINSKKQQDINDSLSTLSVPIDNVEVVDIDNIGKDNKQITNSVQDSLSTSYNSINLN